MRQTSPRLLLLVVLLSFPAACRSAGGAHTNEGGPGATREGFVPLRWSASDGRMFAELPPAGEPFLYWVSLPRGLGSNDVGLDRGQLGAARVLEVQRVGERAMLLQRNPVWRSSSDEPAVRRASEESFAESVVFAFDVVSEEDGRVLVDASDFFVRDAHRVADRLASRGQGSFALDESRSAVLEGEARGFPDNTQVDVLLTFTGDEPGSEVRSTTPDPRSVSLRLRHAFVRLPDDGYQSREFHPRSGYYAESWQDTAAPVDEPLTRRLLVRHRLEKRDPESERSGAVEPIVYYVDRGAPEPVRTALLEGARYWEPVFEAAGFPGGYRVELLPEGADPHDVRYNVVQWVNRSTRGWSYGMTVTDPRTGEILKGHVTLGALRVRQDVLLAEGLLSPYDRGEDSRPLEIALARIRQLAAHEIGHTLGLVHNFASSADGRASVMDYPAPVVRVDGTALDLSDAYRDGCGEWDEVAIRYGYSDFTWQDPHDPERAEREGLARVLADADAAGLHFLTDRDARGTDRAHPLANLWDNGEDPVEYLAHEIEVRRIALERFSAAALKEGRALADLEEVLVPLYLHHRYQLEACVRSLGGVDYAYALRGEAGADALPEPVPGPVQLRALELALETLRPRFLLPEALRATAAGIPPKPPGSADGRERFRPGALLFDPHAAAAASMRHTVELLLDPERAKRLVDQAARDDSVPHLDDVVLSVLGLTRATGADDAGAAHLRARLRELLVHELMRLAASDRVATRVRDAAHRLLVTDVATELGEDDRLRAELTRFLDDPAEVVRELEAPRIPPGSPIGDLRRACGFSY